MGAGLLGGGFGVLDLGAHAFHRLPSGGLQAGDQVLDFGGGASGALRQRANLFSDDGKTTAHFPGASRFNGCVQGQQVGLVGNRANHRQHAADGGRFRGQVFDHLCIALHFIDQCVQPGEAQADDFLPMFHRQPGMAAGVGSLAGITGHLLNGRFQFAERITDERRVTRLMLGAAVQVIA